MAADDADLSNSGYLLAADVDLASEDARHDVAMHGVCADAARTV